MVIMRVLVLSSVCVVSITAYDLEYLQTLMPTANEYISQLQRSLKIAAFTGFGTLQTSAKLLGFGKEDIDCIPRFKCLKNASEKDLAEWLKKQSDDSIKNILTLADTNSNGDKTKLVQWQNTYYPEELTQEQAFERLVQTAHVKARQS